MPIQDADAVERPDDPLAEAWPDGMPEADRLFLAALGERERQLVMRRLDAVMRADRGEPLAPLADGIGLKRAAFFNLRRAWRQRSLAALLPHAARPGRRVEAKADDPRRKRAGELLQQRAGRRNVDIAKLMVAEDPTLVGDGPHGRLVAIQKMERLVRHERARLAVDPAFLRQAYGGGLVLDLSAISIVMEGQKLAVAALLVETASGLILGHAIGSSNETVGVQLEALTVARSFLATRRADLEFDARAAPELALMVPPGVDADAMAAELAPHVNGLVIGRIGGFSYGQQVRQVIGPRVGRIVLQPRRTLAVDIEEFASAGRSPVMPPATARATFAREVVRHNAHREKALVAAGCIDGGGCSAGVLAYLTETISAALSQEDLATVSV